MVSRRFLISTIVVLLAACSGGGAPSSPSLPGAEQSPASRALVPQAMSTVTPEPEPSASTVFGSSWAKIDPFQVFDQFAATNTSMSAQQIQQDAYRYRVVWGSFDPQPWLAGNPKIRVSHYYIPQEDSNLISGHDLAWWQANHPDWILYACDANGNPTTNIAYEPGVSYPDVPLDIHNPAVLQYQIFQSLVPYMQANGYNAVALDEISLSNVTEGGNPTLGQQVVAGDWGCGVWQTNGTFLKEYQSKTDPVFTNDVLNWLATLHAAFHNNAAIAPYHYKILINHSVQSENADQLTMLHDVDLELIEAGYTNYGSYTTFTSSSFFLATLNWVKWVQANGAAIGVIDKFDSVTSLTPDQVEYSIATYLMGNEGAEFLYTAPANGPGYGYGAEQWHQEYATQLGKPCAESYGGASYNASTPNLYYRRFVKGMVVANFGGATQNATLPSNHTYADLENRTVTNPLPVTSDDAWVLLKTDGVNGCQ